MHVNVRLCKSRVYSIYECAFISIFAYPAIVGIFDRGFFLFSSAYCVVRTLSPHICVSHTMYAHASESSYDYGCRAWLAHAFVCSYSVAVIDAILSAPEHTHHMHNNCSA